MKILTWETAKNEGAREALERLRKKIIELNMDRNEGYFNLPVWVKDIADLIEEYKKQYK